MQREQVEWHAGAADTSMSGESSNGDDGWEEGHAAGDAAPPSRIRTGKGVWSAVGRAIDSLIGLRTIGNGGSGPHHHHHSESGIESSHPPDEQDRMEHDHEHRHQRPPTDDELTRARRVRSPCSEPGAQPQQQQHTSELGSSLEFKASFASGTTTAKVPISLTPMQPPPDVLAAMKGRRRESAAVGRRHPRFSTPPADVVAALEKTRKTTLDNRHDGGPALGEDRGEHDHDDEDGGADNR